MTDPRSGARLIAMALTLTEDPEILCRALRVSSAELAALQAGQAQPTGQQFDGLVALIVREQGRLVEKNRALLLQIRELLETDIDLDTP